MCTTVQATLGMRHDEAKADAPAIGSVQRAVGACRQLVIPNQQAGGDEKSADVTGTEETAQVKNALGSNEKRLDENTAKGTRSKESEDPSVHTSMISSTAAAFGAARNSAKSKLPHGPTCPHGGSPVKATGSRRTWRLALIAAIAVVAPVTRSTSACTFLDGDFSPETPFVYLGGDGNLTNGTRLQACEGDCDTDSDCAVGLRCFHSGDIVRSGHVLELPGCTGYASDDFQQANDYCVDYSLIGRRKSESYYGNTATEDACATAVRRYFPSANAATWTVCTDTDAETFFDADGYQCQDWIGYSCLDYSGNPAYTQADMQLVIQHCPAACGVCPTLTAGGACSAVYGASAVTNRTGVGRSCVFQGRPVRTGMPGVLPANGYLCPHEAVLNLLPVPAKANPKSNICNLVPPSVDYNMWYRSLSHPCPPPPPPSRRCSDVYGGLARHRHLQLQLFLSILGRGRDTPLVRPG